MSDAPLGVLLGADSLLGNRSGIGRQALEIARSLMAAPAVGESALLVGERCLPLGSLDALACAPPPAQTTNLARELAAAVPGGAAIRVSWRRRRMRRFAAPLMQRMGGRVVYHEVNMIARPFDGVTVVTVHDLSCRTHATWHSARRRAWIDRRLPSTLAQANRFVCVSDFTAGEMHRHLGIAQSRIDVVHPGVSAIFRPISQEAAAGELGRFELKDRGYILAVSTLEPRKNFDRLLAAHTMLPQALRQRFPLVVAGGRGWGECLSSADADKARRSGVLRLLGHVTDDALAALYARCAAFAYVSLYEGFGLPVLEAMACGAPVVASSTTAVGEIAGDAALRVDPQDVNAIAEALRLTVTEASVADDMARRGPPHAADYDWGQMTTGLVASWRKALAG